MLKHKSQFVYPLKMSHVNTDENSSTHCHDFKHALSVFRACSVKILSVLKIHSEHAQIFAGARLKFSQSTLKFVGRIQTNLTQSTQRC